MLATAEIMYESVEHKLEQNEGMKITYGQILKIIVKRLIFGIVFPKKNKVALMMMYAQRMIDIVNVEKNIASIKSLSQWSKIKQERFSLLEYYVRFS